VFSEDIVIENEIVSIGWVVVKLGDICDVVTGTTPSKTLIDYYGDFVPFIKPPQLVNKPVFNSPEMLSVKGAQKARVVPAGSVLVSCIGNLGKVAIAKKNVAFNQQLNAILENEKINGEYIFYLVQSPLFKNQLNSLSAATTVPIVNKSKFETITIPVAPFIEQQKIVSKLEELFSELDKGIESLKTAQQQLKVYRQAVLNNTAIISRETVTIKDVMQKVQIGPFGSQLHKEDYVENGIPLINPTHIKNGVIAADYSFSILKEKRDELPNYILKEGDIIMGRRGEMGRCGLVTKKETGWFCGTGSLYFRPNSQKADSVFLYYFLSSKSVKNYLEHNAGGTTMANLNKKIINEMPIVLPSIEKQKQIVQEIESRLSVCDKMEETIADSLKEAEGLRQSILKMAFEGRLV
jgi:type I restriction enzyme S subunit